MCDSKIKITHLATSDIIGGAARSAYRLHSGLRSIGCNSEMVVAQRSSSDKSVIHLSHAKGLKYKLFRKIKSSFMKAEFSYASVKRPGGFEPFNTDRSTYSSELSLLNYDADIINVHWVARMLDYKKNLPLLSLRKNIVWTLHDMNAFTGGCHYDHSCGHFQLECGRCPQLGSNSSHDLSHITWKRKTAAFQSLSPESITFVSPSQWLAKQTKKSSLLGRFDVQVIPYGLDLNEFNPRNKEYSRNVLGLPQDEKIILFVAFDVESKRKGFTHLINALQSININDRPFLISIGSINGGVDLGTRYLHLGSITHDRLLSLIYSAADLFVIPSLQDNLPNTVLEAMACGLPSIGFAAGGIPDMIKENETGRLVPSGDEKELASTILRTIQDAPLLEHMSNKCRLTAEKQHSLHRQATDYLNLYRSIKERVRGK